MWSLGIATIVIHVKLIWLSLHPDSHQLSRSPNRNHHYKWLRISTLKRSVKTLRVLCSSLRMIYKPWHVRIWQGEEDQEKRPNDDWCMYIWLEYGYNIIIACVFIFLWAIPIEISPETLHHSLFNMPWKSCNNTSKKKEKKRLHICQIM